jgi:hypothetical protein
VTRETGNGRFAMQKSETANVPTIRRSTPSLSRLTIPPIVVQFLRADELREAAAQLGFADETMILAPIGLSRAAAPAPARLLACPRE